MAKSIICGTAVFLAGYLIGSYRMKCKFMDCILETIAKAKEEES